MISNEVIVLPIKAKCFQFRITAGRLSLSVLLCISARVNFSKKFVNSIDILRRTFAAEAAKELVPVLLKGPSP